MADDADAARKERMADYRVGGRHLVHLGPGHERGRLAARRLELAQLRPALRLRLRREAVHEALDDLDSTESGFLT